MASANSLLCEEQFLCSICLDVFTEPVSTPCGHNYCKVCITAYWDSRGQCQCPLCKEKFHRRPELRVNCFISEMADQFKKSVRHKSAKPAEVPCDVCAGNKLRALKSCLVCLASYCETHLEPHRRVMALKRHKLIEPVENLDDRMCKKHDKFLELFCRSDQTCVCIMCSDHKAHDTVPLEEEYEERKCQLGHKKEEVQRMIHERLQKVHVFKHLGELEKRDAQKEISVCIEIFTAMLATIQRSQSEFIEAIEEKQRAREKQTEAVIRELQLEILELQRRSTALEQLSHTEDPLHLLRSFPALASPPPTKDWPDVSIHSEVSTGTVRSAVAQLEEALSRKMETLLKSMETTAKKDRDEAPPPEEEEEVEEEDELDVIQRQHTVDVTFDPDTANGWLILSEDRKQVRCGSTRQNLPDENNAGRFDISACLLGKEEFAAGQYYYEVRVHGDQWYLGVASETIGRKGVISLDPTNGYWIITFRKGNEYKAIAGPSVRLTLEKRLEVVGVFVDYDVRQVSFFNVETRTLLYTFTGCSFAEKLYPFFGPSVKGDKNIGPLIITPVRQRQ